MLYAVPRVFSSDERDCLLRLGEQLFSASLQSRWRQIRMREDFRLTHHLILRTLRGLSAS